MDGAATGPVGRRTANGVATGDSQNGITAGPRGPLLVQDWQLFEQQAHFNRERIPERVVYARGSGAYGTLTITNDIARYSRAGAFAEAGKQTACFCRFSTVAGERGAADGERDVRGFAMKFYTDAGIWDLVGNNTPVHFVRDPYKFPDFIRTQKRDPRTNMRSTTAMWDFWSRSPESLHQVTILFSDRGLPKSYRHMNGYGSHTYSLINADNQRVWCKFHLKTLQGIEFLTDEQGARLIGRDRDSHQRDLYHAIDNGDSPRWRMCVQVMTDEQAALSAFDPFDLTKVWPHRDFPLIEVGVVELNRNPDNYFADVEQSSFSPANQVPGIGHSPDKMLQFRIFAYADAHRHRLGDAYEALPVNHAGGPAHSPPGDGATRAAGTATGERGGRGGPADEYGYPELPPVIEGAADRSNRHEGNDDYTQPGNLFRLMTPEQQERLFANLGRAMADVPEEIRRRQIDHFSKADPAYGAGVARALGR